MEPHTQDILEKRRNKLHGIQHLGTAKEEILSLECVLGPSVHILTQLQNVRVSRKPKWFHSGKRLKWLITLPRECLRNGACSSCRSNCSVSHHYGRSPLASKALQEWRMKIDTLIQSKIPISGTRNGTLLQVNYRWFLVSILIRQIPKTWTLRQSEKFFIHSAYLHPADWAAQLLFHKKAA